MRKFLLLRYSMVFTGFQTLDDRNNPEYFEVNGPHRCTSPKSWLGFGYYFWESEIKWAHTWGKSLYRQYMIFECKIKYDETVFDIYGNPLHRKCIWGWMEEMKNKNPKIDEDELTIFNIIEYAKKYGKFERAYNAIRAADYPYAQKEVRFVPTRNEITYLGEERVQYCLINKNNLILPSYMVIYPIKYKL